MKRFLGITYGGNGVHLQPKLLTVAFCIALSIDVVKRRWS